MMACHIDIETFSTADLKKVGTYTYAQHPSTEILCVCYAFGDGPVHIWIPSYSAWNPEVLADMDAEGQYPEDAFPREALPSFDKMDQGSQLYLQAECPDDLREWAESGKEFRAWNAQFERTLLNAPPGRLVGFPETKMEQWVCVMAKSQAASLPARLELAASVVGTHPKDSTGSRVMLKLAKPRNPSKKNPDARWYIDKVPEDYYTLYHYCLDDVRAEAALDKYIPDLPPGEIRAYLLDQNINDRGIKVDIESVENIIYLVEEYKQELAAKCVEWTGLRPSQNEKLADWVRQYYEIENLQAPTIVEALKDPECPKHVRRVLQLYSIYNMKAPTKYPTMLRAASPEDQRLRGMFQYHGAGTGRWSSRVVQLQNLFRPVIKDPEEAIEAFRLRCLAWVKDMWDQNPMKVFASCVRGMLVPDLGHLLYCLDFSQIEARVIAWLAGQDDLLAVFLSGEDVYKHAAAGIFRKPIEKVTGDERFVGKIAVLALGYQGGWKAFAKMAKVYGVEMDKEFSEKIKRDWRVANPAIVKLWYQMEEAAIAAVENPGAIYEVAGKKIMFKIEGDWLWMRLPSGRRLGYYRPRVVEGDRGPKLTFEGVDTYTRRWQRTDTYGGKLTENAVQAIARDLLLYSMLNLEKAGFPLVGTVHDEVILEVEEGFATLDEAAEIMIRKPKWAKGIPVATDAFEAMRYRK